MQRTELGYPYPRPEYLTLSPVDPAVAAIVALAAREAAQETSTRCDVLPARPYILNLEILWSGGVMVAGVDYDDLEFTILEN